MSMSSPSGLEPGVAVDRAGVDDGEVELGVVGAELEHELEDLVDDLVRTGARTVDLVDDDHRLEAVLERVLEHEAGLRHRALEGVDDEQAAVGHLQDALDLAAEVGVARRVDDVDLGVVVADGDVLREDGDAALALLVVGVENTLRDLLVVSEDVRGLQEPVHERGLAVVDVGDDGDVADVVLTHDVTPSCWGELCVAMPLPSTSARGNHSTESVPASITLRRAPR